MRSRVFVPVSGVTLVMAVVLWAPVLVAGQARTPDRQAVQEAARKASPRTGDEALKFFEKEIADKTAQAIARVWDPTKPRPTTIPRTPWGDPDLRGYYLSLSYTPLERPDGVTKALYTPEEAIEVFKKEVAEDAAVDPATVHYDWKEFGMDTWQSPVRPNRRTSLITDPPDGKIPTLSPEARKRQAAARRGSDVQLRGLYERCITGNQGPPRLPFNHDSESQILQTKDYVILLMQSNNDVRIVPLDGRPRLDANVRGWLGDARGRWEGNTLVVETTNFHPDRVWNGAAGNMQLVERFTRVDADTLVYEFTVTDPTTWARPWSAEHVWPMIEPPVYEFACHEQNYGLMNVVKGSQVRVAEGGETR